MPEEESLQAYYDCPAFLASLEALDKWKAAHARYCADPTDVTRAELFKAMDFWQAQLEVARATPEHKAVWGW